MMSPMKPRPLAFALLLTILSLALASSAVAKPAPVKPLAEVEVEVGKVGLSAAAGGRASLLIPVRYPIQLTGRVVVTRVALLGSKERATRTWVLRTRLSSGRVRFVERRRGFTFVHRLRLNESLASRVRLQPRIRVTALGRLDVDGRGRAEMRSSDRSVQIPTVGPRQEKGLCSSIPHLRVRPGRRIAVPLPDCDTRMGWRVVAPRFARVKNGRLIYSAPKRLRGRHEIHLAGGERERVASGELVFQSGRSSYSQVTVGAAPGVVVRALGDSVTAGFGYYDDGSSMTLEQLLECRPSAKEFDDACSSNSLNRTSEEKKVEYAVDYGLANNISWVARWANEYGVTNYKNFAISGSEPKDWAPEGELHSTTERIIAEDPDYILMTMGANPLLSNMLFGFDNMGCAVYADVLGGYRECIEEAFAEIKLREYLKSLYTDLVENTEATIFLMQYHLSVPSTALAYSATQIAMMGKLLNREIASVAAEVGSRQLQVVTPPHFDVGIDISPVFPSRYSCSLLDFKVDGPSVQSNPTQDELEVLHPLSFCEGPEDGESPWVISGDTGIHPSASGYAQMASQISAP
jgi:lysophospholipase L1-like esterase